MPMNVPELFERELKRRGLSFAMDEESGQHAIENGGGRMLINLDNLIRDVQSDQDIGRVSRFVDAIEAAGNSADDWLGENLFWSLERNDYDPPPDFRHSLGDRLDRVLIHQSTDGRLLTWAHQSMLDDLNLSLERATELAFDNLTRALQDSQIESTDIDATRLGFINSRLQFKASLILAPNLKQVAGPVLGWPLLAVVPDRNFLYLWDASNSDFCGRVGRVVVQEYSKSSYPLCTEVFEVSDRGIRAIGEFPTGE